MTKDNLRIISKQYAHFKPMAVKFQRNQHKTVGGDAYTLYQVSINFRCKNDYVHFATISDKK